MAIIREAVALACQNPNAGILTGNIGWRGRTVFHGTSQEAAEDIVANGPLMEASAGGFLGRAFYVTPDPAFAATAYADASDESGAVISAMIGEEGGDILDLRHAADWERWKPFAPRIGEPGFDRLMRKNGIAAVYDRSVGGLAVFNPACLENLRTEILPVFVNASAPSI